MAQISVTVVNRTSDNQNAHVFDLFAHGRREVNGSPFALAAGETSPWFGVNADANGNASVAYNCDGGPSLSDIDVVDGQSVEIS